MRHFILKIVISPRQARDKYKESAQKETLRFCCRRLSAVKELEERQAVRLSAVDNVLEKCVRRLCWRRLGGVVLRGWQRFGAQDALIEPPCLILLYKKRSVYHDRLGTNIGITLRKLRFFHSQAECICTLLGGGGATEPLFCDSVSSMLNVAHLSRQARDRHRKL